MTTTPVYPSGSPYGNTYVPSFEASGKLAIQFSRNNKDFAVNRYCTIMKVDRSIGYYLRITPANAARLVSTDRNLWPDGASAYRENQAGHENQETFKFDAFTTDRYKWDFALGFKAVEQASWEVLAVHADMIAKQAMLQRTYLAVQKLTDSAQYASTNTDTAVNLVGGQLEGGTPQNPILDKAIKAMSKVVMKQTLGVVTQKDTHLVMGVDYADTLSRTQEVHTYLKESPAALAQVRGDVPSQNGQWGLPDSLYTQPIVVEDAVRVAQERGQTASPDWVWGTSLNSIALVSRPGKLVSKAGGPNFSALHFFMYEEMTMEQKSDPDNRRHLGRVIEDYGVVMVAPLSAYLLTSAIGTF